MSLHNTRIRAVIFDLDDTLVSEYEFVVSGYKYMSERLSGKLGAAPEEIEARLWELSKETYSRAFNRLFESYGEAYTEEELRELIKLYRNHPAGLRFYPDVRPALEGLKKRGILTGIISDGDPERQKNKIRSAVAAITEPSDRKDGAAGTGEWPGDEIRYWFDEIILNDEFGGAAYRKPDPHGFRVMAERLGTDPAEMIYTGDNPAKDFHIASELPVRTARIIRENGIYRDREYLDGIRETWRIESLTDILEIVDKSGGNAVDIKHTGGQG